MPNEIASPFTDAGETAMAELLGNEVLPSSFVKFRLVSSSFVTLHGRGRDRHG
jgi:hypothetical protein